MRVLLISTYELGRQPVHAASPAGALRFAGHETTVVDLAVDTFDPEMLADIDAVAISVPMHTATRLALVVAEEIGRQRPDLPVALYGLYAGVPGPTGYVDAVFAGEYEPGLISWLVDIEAGESSSRISSRTGRSEFMVPDRARLPSLDRYARLEMAGETRLVGAVEASHGCRHRCRHCPIPSVYDGRMRVVPKEIVLADIDQLVAAGATHITFGDPDFLNAPRHSLDVLAAAHEKYPGLTFDATIKVSHIVENSDLWPDLAEMGLLFVVSAFESVDRRTLEVLDKGHTVDDMTEAVDLVRSDGIHLRPTWLPFVPWTEPSHIVDIFRFIAEHDLAPATDPVQLSIKLLIPRGSLLEGHPEVVPYLDEYDPGMLSWRWRFSDPDTELLNKEMERIAAEGSDCGREAGSTLEEMASAVTRLAGVDLPPFTPGAEPAPRLTESWFCCAEPTQSQMVTLGIGRPEPG